MGLISRVSSRTYRPRDPKMTTWKLCRIFPISEESDTNGSSIHWSNEHLLCLPTVYSTKNEKNHESEIISKINKSKTQVAIRLFSIERPGVIADNFKKLKEIAQNKNSQQRLENL